MLVLSRKVMEVICIGDDIRITVVSVKGDKVRIGVAAPTDVVVHRLEIYNQTRNEDDARPEKSSD